MSKTRCPRISYISLTSKNFVPLIFIETTPFIGVENRYDWYEIAHKMASHAFQWCDIFNFRPRPDCGVIKCLCVIAVCDKWKWKMAEMPRKGVKTFNEPLKLNSKMLLQRKQNDLSSSKWDGDERRWWKCNKTACMIKPYANKHTKLMKLSKELTTTWLPTTKNCFLDGLLSHLPSSRPPLETNSDATTFERRFEILWIPHRM